MEEPHDDNCLVVVRILSVDPSCLAVQPNALLNSEHYDFCNHAPSVLYLSLGDDDPGYQLYDVVVFHETIHP